MKLYTAPCPFCGEPTYYDGQRRYEPEGFPDVHECALKLEPFTETTKPPVVKKQDERRGGIDL